MADLKISIAGHKCKWNELSLVLQDKIRKADKNWIEPEIKIKKSDREWIENELKILNYKKENNGGRKKKSSSLGWKIVKSLLS